MSTQEANAAPAFITIVIVNYETSAYVNRCVQSLATQSTPHEIIIVDNPSPRQDIHNLPAPGPNLQVIPAPENLGYGLGCNLGASHASPRSTHICILNPDTALPPDQLAAWLLSYRVHCPRGGILGPGLFNDNGTIQRSSYQFPNAFNYWLTHSLLAGFLINRRKGHWLGGRGQGFETARDPQQPIFEPSGTARPTGWLMGAALLLDQPTWRAVSGFSSHYFLYSEDTDLCWRLKHHGYPVIYDPQVHIWHTQGDPAGPARETGIIRLFDGLRRFAQSNYPPIKRTTLALSIITDMLLRILIFTPLTKLQPQNQLNQSRLKGYKAVLKMWLS